MYFTADSGVLNGRPYALASAQSGDPNTFNSSCGTWYADRIWLAWSFTDGKTEWNQNDGYGNIPPYLAISPGGAGESALVGDPAVCYWNGQWHMYYEGTDRCDGSGNNIFQAVSGSWFGPWLKLGPVVGLPVPIDQFGLAWPSVLLDNNQLYLYFDDTVVLRVAKATDVLGQTFSSMPNPVISDYVNKAQVVKLSSNHYRLAYDNFGQTELRIADSCNPFSFDSGSKVLGGQVSRPCYLPKERRVYYSGPGNNASIGLLTLPDWY